MYNLLWNNSPKTTKQDETNVTQCWQLLSNWMMDNWMFIINFSQLFCMFENFYNINFDYNCWLNYMSSLLECRNHMGEEHTYLVYCCIPVAVIWYVLNKCVIKDEQVRPCPMRRRTSRPGVTEAVGARHILSSPTIWGSPPTGCPPEHSSSAWGWPKVLRSWHSPWVTLNQWLTETGGYIF